MYSTVSPLGTAATRWADFRDDVAHDRQVEGFGHASDLHPLRDAADPDQVDHDIVDGSCLDHVAEWDDAIDEFAAADWCSECSVNPRYAGVVVMRRDVLEPKQPDPGVFDATPDVDRLFWAPALVDVAHQFDVRAKRTAHHPRPLDLFRGGCRAR